MNDHLDILDLLVAISRMKEDTRAVSTKWYESQKEHWVGWLFEYLTPGAYSRKATEQRSAKLIYNRVVCPDLLLYLAAGSGVPPNTVRRAKSAARAAGPTQMAQAGAVRQIIPWQTVLHALRESGLLSRNRQ